MFRRVRFECGACGDGFVDWHDDDWERSPVFCVHCGAAIVASRSVEAPARARPSSPSSAGSENRPARALGVLKGEGSGFRDTLPGLTEVSASARSDAPESSRDTEPTLPGRASSNATSSVPKANAPNATVRAARRRLLAPIAALLVGFAGGVPAALLAENPLLRLMNPAAYARAQLTEQLLLASSAIDRGDWDRARDLLDRCATSTVTGDARLPTLRARLTLGLILANRPADTGRELAAVQKSPPLHPSVADLQRVYDALFPDKSSAATNGRTSTPPTATSAPAPKAKVTKRELISFARDRQQRAQLDDAERLYREVLRTHPIDAEARCGLAEVQILRGGIADGAKLFARALADNASYVPAWVGLADVDWLSGHPERAACRYQAVIDRFPSSSYPPYIRQRVEQVLGSGVQPPEPRADANASQACDDRR